MTDTAGTFFRALRKLTLGKFLRLCAMFLPHPLFGILSFLATVKAFALAKKYFPETHSKSGIGNAFRHALWTSLIMSYCCKISSPKKAMDWCIKLTTMHEDLFPNNPLERKMDIHNNEVGMRLFQSMLPGIHRQFFETSFFLDVLFEKTKTAKILSDINTDYGDDLVYLK